MAWIRTIDSRQARGLLKRQYDEAVQRAGKIFNIIQISSLNPEIIRDSMRFYRTLMHADVPLSRARREMIAVVVSAVNDCHY